MLGNNDICTTQGGGGATSAVSGSAVQSQLRLSARNYVQAFGWKEYAPSASLRSSFLPGLNLFCDCSCCGEQNIHIAEDLAQEFDVVEFILKGDFKCPVPECNNALTFKDLVFKAPSDKGLNFSVHGRFQEQEKEDLTTLELKDAKRATCPKGTCYVMMSSAQEQEEESRRDQGIRGEEHVGDSVEWVELFISCDSLLLLDFNTLKDCCREEGKEPFSKKLAKNVFFGTLNDGSGATIAVKEEQNFGRFNRRLRNFLRLDHPNIIKLIGYCVTQGNSYLVFHCLEPLRDRNNPLQHNVAAYLAKKVCDIGEIIKLVSAVVYLHSKGYVNSNIKPDKLVWSKEKGLTMSDLEAMRKINSGGISCTLPFSPPERAKMWLFEVVQRFYSSHSKTPIIIVESSPEKSDIYSLGMTILSIYCGKMLPWTDDFKRDAVVPYSVRQQLLSCVKDQKMQAILHDMLKDDPSERPSLETVLSQLKALQIEQSQADIQSTQQQDNRLVEESHRANQNDQGFTENKNEQTRNGVAGGGAASGAAPIQQEESSLERGEGAATYSVSHQGSTLTCSAHASTRVLLHCWAKEIPYSVGPSFDTMLKLMNAKFGEEAGIPRQMLEFFGVPRDRRMEEQYPEFQELLHKTGLTEEKDLYDYFYFPPVHVFSKDVSEVTQEELLNYCKSHGLLILRFGLTEVRWNKWDRFFKKNPKGILTAQNLELAVGETEDENATTGHAMVIDLRESTKEYLVLINSLGDRFAHQGTCRIKNLSAINGCEHDKKNPTFVMGCKLNAGGFHLDKTFRERYEKRLEVSDVPLVNLSDFKAFEYRDPLEFCITPNSGSTNRLQQGTYYEALFENIAVAVKPVRLYDFVDVPDEKNPQTYHLEPVINHEIRAIAQFQKRYHKHLLLFFGFCETRQKHSILRLDEPSQYVNNILLVCERPQHTLESWLIDQGKKEMKAADIFSQKMIESKEDDVQQHCEAYLEIMTSRKKEIWRMLNAIFQAVAFLEMQGIQHRNINPSHIFLVDGVWKLGNFSDAVIDGDPDGGDERNDNETVLAGGSSKEQIVGCGGGGAAAVQNDSVRRPKSENNQRVRSDVSFLGNLINNSFFPVLNQQDSVGKEALMGLAETLQTEGTQRPSANEALNQFMALKGSFQA